MRYGVLGTIDVLGDDSGLDVGGPQQRRLLGVLLSHPGRVFSVDSLVDALWAEGEAPDGAKKAVLTYMSRLRARVGSGSIITRGGGYLLVAGSGSIDSIEFEGLVKRARASDPDAAVQLYDAALELWRGRAFGDFASEWWAISTAKRLEELRAVASEERAAALIAVGRGTRAIPEMEALLIEYPLRERVVELLMHMLDEAGRTAEALRVFQAFRQSLIDQTGLDPSARLTDLEARIATGVGPAAIEGRPLRGYVLYEVIGRGAHGTVYAARQPATERIVAIKVIRAEFADTPEYVRRFDIEAKLVARIEHPHIVPLYDYWREPGGAFVVLRLMRGGTAEQSLVVGGRWSFERVGRLVEQVGNALVTAHAAGVAHRDVRPANILLDEADNMFISDFGIADAGNHTSARAMLGDLRDFAFMVWELIVGSPPTASPWGGSLPMLIDRVDDVPAGVDAVLERAVAMSGADGFESMAEFVLAWRAAVSRRNDTLGPVGSTANRTTSERRLAARQLSATALAGVNPYRGLRPFDEADAGDFCGRAVVTESLFAAVRERSLVAVVGPSGCGKSSLVQAGLVPLLRNQDGALICSFSPGTHPLESLHAALTVISTTTLDPADPIGSIRSVAEQADSGLVLIIDQFEECWTSAGEADRDMLLSALADCTQAESLWQVSVVVTLRADMYDRPLQHRTFGPIIGPATFAVAPMAPAELEDAVQLPAARAFVSFEDGIVASIVTETASNPASLPLLQFTLFELFERRTDGRITVAAYGALGGIAGSVAKRADDLYLASAPSDREIVRRLFERLVTPGHGSPDSRRRALIGDLPKGSSEVIDRYAAARLLVRDHDRSTRQPTIEVAHEAILTRWARLGEWIDEDRMWLDQLLHLSDAARAWDDTGRPAADLYRGSRLETALEALPRRGDQLTTTETAFIHAGRHLRDAELEHQRRSSKRLRRSLVGVGLLLVVTMISAVLALAQRRTADRTTRAARVSALIGDVASLRSTHRDTAALLAIEAFRLGDTAAARSALLSTFTSTPGFLDIRRLGGDVSYFAGAVSPTGSAAFVIDRDNLVRPYDLASGSVGDAFPRTLPAVAVDNLTGAPYHPGASTISVLALSPDGARLAQVHGILDAKGTGTTSVSVYDMTTRRPVGNPIEIGLSAGTFVFSPDHRLLLVSGGANGSAVAFDVATGRELARREGHDPAVVRPNEIWQTAGMVFLDPQRVAVGAVADTVSILDPVTLQPTAEPIPVPPDTTQRLVALGDGTLLGSGRKGVVRIDPGARNVMWAIGATQIDEGGCAQLAAVLSRERFYCGDGSGRLEERSLADGSRVRDLDTQNGAAESLWPSPDGTDLVAFGASERIVSRFRLDGSGPIARRVAPGLAPVQYSPNGANLIVRTPLTDSINDSVEDANALIDSTTGDTIEQLGHLNSPFWNSDTLLGGTLTTPDGRLQLATYQPGSHVINPLAFTFTRSITHNVTNAGQPKAWVAVPNDDGTSQVWTFERATVRRIEPTVTIKGLVALTGSPDGRHFAVSTTTGVEVFDGDTGAQVAILDRSDLRGVWFVDNELLAVSSLSGELTLHDALTLRTVRTLSGSRGFIQDVQPTRDGSLIAIDGVDGVVQLVDTASGTAIGGAIPVPIAEWNGVVLQGDGQQMAVGGGGPNGFTLWDLDPQHWVTAACRLAGRNLTEAEWHSYLGALDKYHTVCP